VIEASTAAKALAAGITTGAVLAVAETIPPEYALAGAAIALAGLAIRSVRRGTPAKETVSNSVLKEMLTSFAYGQEGRGGMFQRIDQLDEKLDTLSGKVDIASLKLENHSVRIDHVERQCAEERLKHRVPHNAAGFGG
jgi:hypothetical protein